MTPLKQQTYEFEVCRYGFGKNSTLGFFSELTGPLGKRFICFTLEDERRETKVYGETCIPAGTYTLERYQQGSKHEDYARRFGPRHHGMILLKKVEGFTGVLIHILNFESQTDGCIGVGKEPGIYSDGEFFIGRSEPAYLEVYDLIMPKLIAGHNVLLHVTEMQPWA